MQNATVVLALLVVIAINSFGVLAENNFTRHGLVYPRNCQGILKSTVTQHTLSILISSFVNNVTSTVACMCILAVHQLTSPGLFLHIYY